MHRRQRLSAYCLNELPPAEARLVERHLAECARCRGEVEEAGHGVALLAHLAPCDAPPLWPEIEAKIEGRPAFAPGRAALACGTAAALALLLLTPHPQGPAWEVRSLAGRPEVAGRRIASEGRIAPGQRLVTGEGARARIAVGDIGQVEVDPGSRVRLVSAREKDHRLALERGRLRAFIWAPPGRFFVDTPSAVAVDLGCAYTLEVSDDGRGLLEVTSGWVAFESDGQESFVPAGARCVTRPRLGPGTPFYPDAAPELLAALELLDTRRAGGADVARLVAASRERDALTLWHLLARTPGEGRAALYAGLARFVPPPAEATRSAVLRGDRAALDAWWNRLGLGDTSWWRHWKGPVPGHAK